MKDSELIKILEDEDVILEVDDNKQSTSLVPASQFEMEMYGNQNGISYPQIKDYNNRFKRFNNKIRRKVKSDLLRGKPIGKLVVIGSDYVKDKLGVETEGPEVIIDQQLDVINDLRKGLMITIGNYHRSIQKTREYGDYNARKLLMSTMGMEMQYDRVKSLREALPILQEKARNGNEEQKISYTFSLRRLNQKLLEEKLKMDRDKQRINFSKNESPFVNDLLDTAIHTMHSLKSIHQETVSYQDHVGQTLELYLGTIIAGELCLELDKRVNEMSKFTDTIDNLFNEGIQRLRKGTRNKALKRHNGFSYSR